MPAISRSGDRTPSQATTRSAGSSRSPASSRTRTPTIRSPSLTRPTTSCPCRTGTPSARIALTRTNEEASATGGTPSPRGAISHALARTSGEHARVVEGVVGVVRGHERPRYRRRPGRRRARAAAARPRGGAGCGRGSAPPRPLPRSPPSSGAARRGCRSAQPHPLVAPQVRQVRQVPARTMSELPHDEQICPVESSSQARPRRRCPRGRGRCRCRSARTRSTVAERELVLGRLLGLAQDARPRWARRPGSTPAVALVLLREELRGHPAGQVVDHRARHRDARVAR